jgi:choline dehydrogenase-like flavoprotein
MYRSEPDPGTDNRVSYWPRGKVIGGSSSINAMVYIRGHPGDFDDWAGDGKSRLGLATCCPISRKAKPATRAKPSGAAAGAALMSRPWSATCIPACGISSAPGRMRLNAIGRFQCRQQ